MVNLRRPDYVKTDEELKQYIDEVLETRSVYKDGQGGYKLYLPHFFCKQMDIEEGDMLEIEIRAVRK